MFRVALVLVLLAGDAAAAPRRVAVVCLAETPCDAAAAAAAALDRGLELSAGAEADGLKLALPTPAAAARDRAAPLVAEAQALAAKDPAAALDRYSGAEAILRAAAPPDGLALAAVVAAAARLHAARGAADLAAAAGLLAGRLDPSLAPASAPALAALPVRVTSSPTGARVWIDGVVAGFAPLDVALAPGEHIVTASLPGYQPRGDRVGVVARAAGSIDVPLLLERLPHAAALDSLRRELATGDAALAPVAATTLAAELGVDALLLVAGDGQVAAAVEGRIGAYGPADQAAVLAAAPAAAGAGLRVLPPLDTPPPAPAPRPWYRTQRGVALLIAGGIIVVGGIVLLLGSDDSSSSGKPVLFSF